MTKWIEILKTGKFTAKNGKDVTITSEDIDNLIQGFDPEKASAPLVFGHPEDSHPAYGWADGLKRVGDVLLAKFKQVPQAVTDLVSAGHYKKISVSLTPDKKTLRHVGLLGAARPAVPGLADVAFEAGDDDVLIYFSNPSTKETQMGEVEELKAKLAAEETARKEAQAKAQAAEAQLSESKKKALEASMESRIDALVGKQILAADKPLVKQIAMALGETGEEIELSEGKGKKRLDDHLFDFLSTLPDRNLLTEFSNPDPDGKKETTTGGSTEMMGRV
jgi:hypothetical protein